MTNSEIARSLAANQCPTCDSSKAPKQSFCKRCYLMLPMDLKGRLYTPVPAYFDVFRSAFEFIKDKRASLSANALR